EPAYVGNDAGDPRPPVREVVRLGEERPHVLTGREELARRLLHRIERERSSIRLRSAGDASVATTIARRPASARIASGQMPTRGATRRETPFASTRISPTFSPA